MFSEIKNLLRKSRITIDIVTGLVMVGVGAAAGAVFTTPAWEWGFVILLAGLVVGLIGDRLNQ